LDRREFAPADFLLPIRFTRVFARFIALPAARRVRGFAPGTFFVNSFCTAPAFAASVPNVAPIDSATLVRIVSSLDGLWLSTVNPFAQHEICVDRTLCPERA
jgi:hypothetical protein